MDQNMEIKHDPKGLGQPPPYTPSGSAEAIPTTSSQVGQSIPIVVGQPTTTGQITHTGGMYTVHVAPGMMPMLIGNQVGSKPTTVTCQSCKQVVLTKIKARANTHTHLCAYVFALFCCWPCVLIPYCTNQCRNMDHHCPNCDAYIGSYVSCSVSPDWHNSK